MNGKCRSAGAAGFSWSTPLPTTTNLAGVAQADLEKHIKEIAETCMRYGYRRVHVVLLREGWMTNIKRTYRLYTGLGLQLRNKTPRRRVKAKLREDRCPASMPYQTWAMDFVHDELAMGKKIRVLTVIDIFSKFSPVIDPRFNHRAENVVMTLEQVCRELGYPKTIRVDQGSEFISRDLDLWAYTNDVILDFSRPGKPTDTDVVDKRYVVRACNVRPCGFARHREVKLA